MGHYQSEQTLPGGSETLKGNEEHNSTSEIDKQDNNNKKETADEEDPSSSDKPDGEVRVDQTEDATKENHESIADEQVKENIQGNQESQGDGSKDVPATAEDSGVSLGQEIDDSSQLVSLVCHIWKVCQETE